MGFAWIPKSVVTRPAVGFEEGRPLRRYGLHDDEWDRIKDLLPGREGDVGVTAKEGHAPAPARGHGRQAAVPIRSRQGENRLAGARPSSRQIGLQHPLARGARVILGQRRIRLSDPLLEHDRNLTPAHQDGPSSGHRFSGAQPLRGARASGGVLPGRGRAHGHRGALLGRTDTAMASDS
jgi:hypothetical protein